MMEINIIITPRTSNFQHK